MEDGDVSGKLAASRHFSVASHVGVTGICVIALSRHSHLWTCGSVCGRGSSFFKFCVGVADKIRRFHLDGGRASLGFRS